MKSHQRLTLLGALGCSVTLLCISGCAHRSPAQQASPQAACPVERAVVIHNDSPQAIDLIADMTAPVLRAFATVLAGAQSDPLPVSKLHGMGIRSSATGARVSGVGIRYEFMCLPGS